jgi:hypothetical protein
MLGDYTGQNFREVNGFRVTRKLTGNQVEGDKRIWSECVFRYEA